MIRHALLAAAVLAPLALAQPLERAKDRQDLRQDRRQTQNDRVDFARATTMLREYDQAASLNNVQQLSALDAAFNAHIAGEIRESKVESGQKTQEVREDRREVRSDKTVRDQINRADDRRDAAKERLSRERLVAIQAQLGGYAGRFDPTSLGIKRQLYGEVVNAASREISGNQQEKIEDHKELREDRRQR